MVSFLLMILNIFLQIFFFRVDYLKVYNKDKKVISAGIRFRTWVVPFTGWFNDFVIIDTFELSRKWKKLLYKLKILKEKDYYVSYNNFFKQLQKFNKKELTSKYIYLISRLSGKEGIPDYIYKILKDQPKRKLIREIIRLSFQLQNGANNATTEARA